MEKTILENGLTILSENNPYSKSVVLGYAVKTGSYYEMNYPIGTAHFVEHMLFKGTKNRNYRNINRSIMKTGGELNAYTSYEQTKYYVELPYDKWEIGVEILSDIIWNSTIPEEEIIKEKNIILEEIAISNDDPDDFLQNIIIQEMFPNMNKRQTILGNKKSIKKINRNILLDFINEFYIPSNMVFIATGNINHSELVQFLKRYSLSKTKSSDIKTIEKYEPVKLDNQIITYSKNNEQAHLGWGLLTTSIKDEDMYVLEVITYILGESMDSRLYNIIREDNGLAYSVRLDHDFHSDIGFITGTVGSEKENIDKIKELIINEFLRFTTEKVSKEELEDNISAIVGSMMISLESNRIKNNLIGDYFLNEMNLDPMYHLNKIKKVTQEDILRVSKKYFKKDNFIFIKILPN